ncbi:MAG TPA: helix-turn-helix domain-containing protein [Bryobacteraceae bacterium]|nr:hypothetical protein [Bryobacterales bacterium]HRJ19339.1 helix-turn-helix domain-containing protein [Bryobacteraceae bacterium]
MEKLFLRPSEVGPLIGFGKTMVYKLIQSGELPSRRIGKSIRVSVAALEKWADEKGVQFAKAIHRRKSPTAHNHRPRKGGK